MAEILDQFGRPIKREALGRPPLEIATAAQISQWQDSVATGLTPTRLASVLRDNDTGQTLDMLTLAVEMEERDPHYFSQIQGRQNAVSGAPLRVEPSRSGDKKLAKEIAEAYQYEVVEKENFRFLLSDLTDAISKSYSVVQPIWDTSTRPWTFKAFKWFDPRSFQWDKRLEELRIRVDGSQDGRALPAGMFIIHFPRIRTGVKLRGGIARLAAINYLFKTHTVKDWIAFAEVYGMPIRVGKYGPNATEEEKLQMRRALVNLGHDAAMMMPEGMDISIVDARRPTSGDNLFKGLADYFDEQTSKAINGITSGSDAKAKGIGTGESDLQEQTRLDIRQADAWSMQDTLKYLARFWTEINYGVGAPVPSTFLDVTPPEDKAAKATTLSTIADAYSKFKAAGREIPADWIEDEFGVPLNEVEVEDPESTDGDNEDKSADGDKPEDKGKKKTAANAALPDNLDFAEDVAADLLGEWTELLSPHRDALLAAAEGSEDFPDFMAKLKTLAEDINSDPLVRAMAIAAMKARGVASAGSTN